MEAERAEVQAKIREARGEMVQNGKVRFDVNCHDRRPRVTFRVPDFIDIARLDRALPVLPADKGAEEADEKSAQTELEKIFRDPDRCERFMARADQMMMWCALEPTLVPHIRMDDEEGTLSVRSITSIDRAIVFQALLGLAGFSGEAAAQVAPFAVTADSSKPATGSGNGTGVGPRTSSIPVADGTPSKG